MRVFSRIKMLIFSTDFWIIFILLENKKIILSVNFKPWFDKFNILPLNVEKYETFKFFNGA